ncbi:hypothetical protein CEXT_765581 [Caerostris extrusa]|uniref:Uncharacterized protein n=1 Tax=Caerostris extrusa TaxID=172846 RepID=A0AAV4XWZ4_CAEEX|nr:hypothetical protein CEXT_765581 [Caerostris extrusa]
MSSQKSMIILSTFRNPILGWQEEFGETLGEVYRAERKPLFRPLLAFLAYPKGLPLNNANIKDPKMMEDYDVLFQKTYYLQII